MKVKNQSFKGGKVCEFYELVECNCWRLLQRKEEGKINVIQLSISQKKIPTEWIIVKLEILHTSLGISASAPAHVVFQADLNANHSQEPAQNHMRSGLLFTKLLLSDIL